MEYTHNDLIVLAEKWLLKSRGCGFVLTELRTAGYEIPDAIGFRSDCSVLVECKATRADFLSDGEKIFRANPSMGMGDFRFYLSPKGVIERSDLPNRWGLVWVSNGKARQIVGPKGNCWGYGSDGFRFDSCNKKAEWVMMVSALRRLHLRGVLPMIYENPFDEQNCPDMVSEQRQQG